MRHDLILTSISNLLLQNAPLLTSPFLLFLSFLSFFFYNPLSLISTIYKCLGTGSYNGACKIYQWPHIQKEWISLPSTASSTSVNYLWTVWTLSHKHWHIKYFLFHIIWLPNILTHCTLGCRHAMLCLSQSFAFIVLLPQLFEYDNARRTSNFWGNGKTKVHILVIFTS